MRYFGSAEANKDMMECKQGMPAFLRAYYHVKSADWAQNKPYPLKSGTAAELAELPKYYIRNLHEGMAESVADDMPSKEEIDACEWLPENEMAYYTQEFARTSFKGGLRWFQCQTGDIGRTEIEFFSGERLTFHRATYPAWQTGRPIASPSLWIR